MNDYKIIDKFGCDFDYSFLDKIILKTLEMENIEKSTFSIVFINDERMHEMNKTYRGIDNTTDVLSFAFEDNNYLELETRELGEIYISIPRMIKQASDYGHGITRELAFLTVHGILHLLGYDHTLGEKEEKEMFHKQEVVLDEFEETRKQKND